MADMVEMKFAGNEKITIYEGSIEHNFYGDEPPAKVERNNPPFYGAIESLTSLLLAMHSRGIDMTTPEMNASITETLDFISNNFGDE